MPSEFDRPDYYLPRETRRIYQRLLERRRPLRVQQIDDDGIPWIHCRFQSKNGVWEYHYLAFNHDGWVRIKHRC
ncbi:MAG: hypothetical protein JXB10_00040 [Pirellulales bacterium]|nr:hypothetical protein [Pirellulales bacterium]